MPDYYLYLFDAKGVIAKRVDLIGLLDDDQARDVAAAHQHKGDMELWQGGRRVERFSGLDVRQAEWRPDSQERAVYQVDKNLRFLSANETAFAYWERTPADLVGQRLGQAFPSAVGSRPYEAHLECLRTGQPYRATVVSPVLAVAIDLEIVRTRSGLHVNFQKISRALADTSQHAA